jgi:RNA polymerase sigma-70 factor, ECF subfamily
MLDHEHLGIFSDSDEDLLRNIGRGCADCFAQLFHRYCGQVFSVSFRILRDKAETEDILQEVFLAIYLQHEKFDASKGSVRTWILQFAYFKALLRRRYLRVRNFYKQEEISEARQPRRIDMSEFLGMSAAEWGHYVERGISTLNAKQRQVISLVHFDGCTLQEASEKVRDTLATTRNNYYRGLKELRNFLQARDAVKRVRGRVTLGRKDAYGFESET